MLSMLLDIVGALEESRRSINLNVKIKFELLFRIFVGDS